MHNNKFVISTFILLIGGFFVKMLGMIIRVVYTRYIGEYGISLYNLIMPTYSLLLSICTFSLPISISKLVSSRKYRSKKIGLSALYIVMILNFILISIGILLSRFIATNLLHEPLCRILLICALITIPFVSISSIIKGYFYGKQNMVPSTVSNILEQVVRLGLLVFFLPKLVKINVFYGVMAILLLNVFSESFSIFVMYFFLPKHVNLRHIEYSKECTSDILKISVPSVSSRLIGNISYFFEPILITSILLFLGYSKDFIILEYGVYNSYAISLLLIPSFFVTAISNALLPEISKHIAVKNKHMINKRMKQSLSISFGIGLFFCLLIFFFRDFLLQFLYNTTSGNSYIKVIAPFFVLFYLEAPLSSILIALGGNKDTFIVTTVGVLIKNIVLISCLFLGLAMYALVVAEMINIFFVLLLDYYFIKKRLASR